MEIAGLADLLAYGLTKPTFSGAHTEMAYRSKEQQTVRVWRRGRLGRVETLNGQVEVIAGDRFNWLREGPGPVLTPTPRDANREDLEFASFANLHPQEYWLDWFSLDEGLVLHTLSQRRLAGRRAWMFRAPEVKGVNLELAVDADLGLVLRATHPLLGVMEEWTELDDTTDLPDCLFEL